MSPRKKECRHPGTTKPRRLGVATAETGQRMLAPLDSIPRTMAVKLHDLEVQAALRGDKCEIRRPLRTLVDVGEIDELTPQEPERELWRFIRLNSTDRSRYQIRTDSLVSRCPYGVRGGRLHVTEAWAWDEETQSVLHRADQLTTQRRQELHARGVVWKSDAPPPGGPRLIYEISMVWVERLQPMTWLELRNEGWLDGRIKRPTTAQVSQARQAFANAWDRSTLHENLHWKRDPWVWLFSLKRVTP